MTVPEQIVPFRPDGGQTPIQPGEQLLLKSEQSDGDVLPGRQQRSDGKAPYFVRPAQQRHRNAAHLHSDGHKVQWQAVHP